MTCIYLDDELVWNKDHLPNEKDAAALLKKHIDARVSETAAEALSAGIDVVINGKRFYVVLSGEERKFSRK